MVSQIVGFQAHHQTGLNTCATNIVFGLTAILFSHLNKVAPEFISDATLFKNFGFYHDTVQINYLPERAFAFASAFSFFTLVAVFLLTTGVCHPLLSASFQTFMQDLFKCDERSAPLLRRVDILKHKFLSLSLRKSFRLSQPESSFQASEPNSVHNRQENITSQFQHNHNHYILNILTHSL